jgi:hypothetical protein
MHLFVIPYLSLILLLTTIFILFYHNMLLKFWPNFGLPVSLHCNWNMSTVFIAKIQQYKVVMLWEHLLECCNHTWLFCKSAVHM